MRFDQKFVQKALAHVEFLATNFPETISFSIDTRTLQQGDIFVALPGEQVDGHDFIAQALTNGAAGLLINAQKKELLNTINKKLLANKLIMLVPDTLKAFLDLAAAWRAQFSYPVVAITGSVGKTSTKELVASVLKTAELPFIGSQGTQNTLIGLALNILKMRHEHKAAIFEVGISKRGEMAQLAGLLKPTTAVITLVGHAHMEGLGSLNDIAQEKREIFHYFTESNIGIINGDQAILASVGYNHPVIKFGYKTVNQIQARKVQANTDSIDFVLKIYKEKFKIQISRPHEGAVVNCLAASAVCYLLQIPSAKIVEGIQKPLVVKGRFEQYKLKNDKGFIIHDCYNANPESVKAAILAFERIETAHHKVVILADMLELGPLGAFWHRQMGRFLRKAPSVRDVILVGDMVKWTKQTLPVGVAVEHVPSWKEAIDKLEHRLQKQTMVLVKGSRGNALENLVYHFAQAT
jgi:UDP-N-acetylmuramoyl-tripeptide--D-alanyl-D-alanine ligase